MPVREAESNPSFDELPMNGEKLPSENPGSLSVRSGSIQPPGLVQFSAEVNVCGGSESRLDRLAEEDLAAGGLEKAEAESRGRESSREGRGKESGGGGSTDLGEISGSASVKDVTSEESLHRTDPKVETWKGREGTEWPRAWGGQWAARCRRTRPASCASGGARALWPWTAWAFWARIRRRREASRRGATGRRRRTAWRRPGRGRARDVALREREARRGTGKLGGEKKRVDSLRVRGDAEATIEIRNGPNS